MRQDRSRPQPAGPVVHIEIVERVGKEPGDLGDLAVVLGQVGLPVRAGLGGQPGRLAEHLRRAADGEPRRERVPEPALVAHVPARTEIGRLPERQVERLDRGPIPCPGVVRQPVHHHLADDRPDAVGLGGTERRVGARLPERAVEHRRRRPGGREGAERGRRELLRPRPRRRPVRAGRCSARAIPGAAARTPGRRSGAAAGARGGR